MNLHKCRHIVFSLSLSALLIGSFILLIGSSQVARATPRALFVKASGSGNLCSRAQPCSLQTALGQSVNGDTIHVAGGVYKGAGAAVVTLTESITLYGGWNGAAIGPVVHDPAAYPSTLDGERARRVVHISGNITPTLDGFIITRGNATGLLAGCPGNPDGCGGGIYVYYAHPIIVNNTITNNIAAITTSGFATGTTGYGGGLYLGYADRAVITGNLIISNAASTAYWGVGGGIDLAGSAKGTQLLFNQVLSNSATTQNVIGEGGGIAGGPDDVLIQGNTIVGNQTNSAGMGRGAGLSQFAGSAHYLSNLVQGNRGSDAVNLQYSQARLEGNRVVDNATSGGISLWSRSGNGPTLINNIVARSGSTTLSVHGYSASTIMTATLLHNTLVGSGTGYGIYASYAALFLTNTIIVSHTWGITSTTPASSTTQADHTLFWANTHVGIQGTNPVSGDPAFVNPSAGDYHIGPASAAKDTGANAGVFRDIDGDPRPWGTGFDIGADEHVPSRLRRLRVPLVYKR